MSFEITLPKRNESKPVVTTPMMKKMATRTLAVHPGSALVVWTGRHRLGKTTTARWLVDQINAQYEAVRTGKTEADPERPVFRAHHYAVAQIPQWARNPEKHAIRSLYHTLVGPLDPGVYQRLPAEGLAQDLVHAIRKRDIQTVFVDEAGKLSLDAIDGMVSVRDKAEEVGHPLSLVFIGMGDLPAKIEQRPRIYSRVHEWCFFTEYSLKDMWDFIADLHPHFAALDRDDPDAREQVAFVRDTVGGFPGEIVPFLRKLDAKRLATNEEITLTLLKVVHMITEKDRTRSVEISGQTNPDTGSKAPVSKRPRTPDDARRGRNSEVPTKKGRKSKGTPKGRSAGEANNGDA